MSLTALAFWVVFVGGICSAVVYPVLGCALYVLVYHLNPESQWWGASFAQAGFRPLMTIAAATVLGIILRRPRFENGARQFPLPVVLTLALVAYGLMTIAWAHLPWDRTTFLAEKTVKLAIFMLILVRCVRQPAHYHLVILSWLAGVAYIGYQAWGNVGVQVHGRLTVGLGGSDFAESSDLAVHLIASLPLLGALFFMARTWWGRGFALVVGALAVNTIIMTRTRNAIVGLLAMSFVALFWLPRGYRCRGLAAMVVGAVLAVQLTDPGWWQRMRTIQNYKLDASAAGRLEFWSAAVDMAYHHPFGVGLGQYHRQIMPYTPNDPVPHSAHNTFLECLAEFGWPGFALLVALLLITLWRTGAVRRAAPKFASDTSVDLGHWSARFHLGWHAMAIQSALVGYLACGIFTTRLWAEDLWILIGLAICLQNVRLYQEAHAASPQPASQHIPDGALHPPVPATPPP